MRQVVLYELLSLDGVAESPDAFILHFDEVMNENLRRVIDDQDTVILGRRSYDEWAEFWPDSDIEPFSSFINAVEKFVVTSETPERTWQNSTVVNGSPEDLVRSLRELPGRDIGVHASITLSRALLQANLVDELRLVVAPALMGTGRRLFDETGIGRFEITRTEVSPTGYLLVDLRLI